MGFVVPEQAVTHFHLHPGDRVGDFGAGGGQMTRAIAKALRGNGKVFAIEIQKELAQSMKRTMQQEHIQNVEVLWGDLEETEGVALADGTLNAGVLSNTLFQLEEKAVAVAEIARTLEKGACLFVIDWSESFSGMGPEPSAVVTEDAAKTLVTQHGFSFERSFPAGEHHYGLVFKKT